MMRVLLALMLSGCVLPIGAPGACIEHGAAAFHYSPRTTWETVACAHTFPAGKTGCSASIDNCPPGWTDS